ncbi:MAG: hypothetical protein E6I91_02300 [Chloroflexi bacterium]|nr:MAG: hypothetical protein E6I91_02300 [Chloroflexota bacterium]
MQPSMHPTLLMDPPAASVGATATLTPETGLLLPPLPDVASRPNCNPLYSVFTPSAYLHHSPSPFRPAAWAALLAEYPGELPSLIDGILRCGARIGYTGPPQLILSKNLASALDDPNLIAKKISEELEAGLIRPVTPSKPFICSPLGLVPKGDGGWRRIHHLSFPDDSSVNAFIPREFGTLTYVTFDEIISNVVAAGRCSIIIKRDIKDAFRNIPVAISDQWLLGFYWNDTYYCERALSFGLRTAPMLFNLFAEAFHWILLRVLRYPRLNHYLDDFIFVLSQQEAASQQQLITGYRLLTDFLGIPRKDSKDTCGTIATVLGIEVDTVKMEARLPSEKITKVLKHTHEALKKGTMNRHEAESLAGLLSFCARVVRLGRTFTQSLFLFIAKHPGYYRQAKLNKELEADLRWWSELLPQFNGVRLLDDRNRVSVSLWTDASNEGLGAFYKSSSQESFMDIPEHQAIAIRANKRLRRKHINIKETIAVLRALERWGPLWASTRLNIYTDSSTVFTGLSTGSIRSPAMEPLKRILLLAIKHDILIEAAWIPGVENKLADALSRFDYVTIANLCPHWQSLSRSKSLRASGVKQTPRIAYTRPSYGTA